MGDLTPNLSRHEFACQCGCGYDTVDFDLPTDIQECRDDFQKKHPEMDVRITVTSGNRCDEHNCREGGTVRKMISVVIKSVKHLFPDFTVGSQHLYAKACDFLLYDKKTGKAIHADKVADYLEKKYPKSKGIGRYKGRTHFDERTTRHRWDNR